MTFKKAKERAEELRRAEVDETALLVELRRDVEDVERLRRVLVGGLETEEILDEMRAEKLFKIDERLARRESLRREAERVEDEIKRGEEP